jgi:hypothetical protein
MAARRNTVAFVSQLLFDALGGKLGAPMMVLAYLSFAVCLLAYVSTQVYTNALMEDVAARRRAEVAVRERIGLLTARYATMTSKSRVSSACEDDLGLVESTTRDVVRVAVDGAVLPESSGDADARADAVLEPEVPGLTRVMRR